MFSTLEISGQITSVKRGRYECMAQGVRSYRLGDPGAAGHPAHGPRGPVPVQPLPIGAAEDRPVHAFGNSPRLAANQQPLVEVIHPRALLVRSDEV